MSHEATYLVDMVAMIALTSPEISMIFISVASATQYSKSYSNRQFDSAAQLRDEIAATGRNFVYLVSVNRWAESWENYATNIPVMSLNETHLAWLAEPAVELRYLVCGL